MFKCPSKVISTLISMMNEKSWISGLVVLFYLQSCNSDVGRQKVPETNSSAPEPTLLSNNQSVVVVEEGATISLPCSAQDLAFHHAVSWLRVAGVQVLTVGGFVFSSDRRVEVTVQTRRWHTAGTWTLRINRAAQNDSGTYQCQINTDPASTFDVEVAVISRATTKPGLSEVVYSADQPNSTKKEEAESSTTLEGHVDDEQSNTSKQTSNQNHHDQRKSGFMNPHSPLTFQDPITVGSPEPTRAHDSSSQSDASDLAHPTNHGSTSSPIGGDNSKHATEAENKSSNESYLGPNPQKSVLEKTLQTQNNQDVSELAAVAGAENEEDGEGSGLLKPIISLFSVAAFIVFLGTVRSIYSKPKRSCEDKRKQEVDQKQKPGLKRKKGKTKKDIGEETQYLEVSVKETPLVEVIRPSPSPLQQQQQQQQKQQYNIGCDGPSCNTKQQQQQQQHQHQATKQVDFCDNPRIFAGITKPGARRSRERCIVGDETLHCPTSLGQKETLPCPTSLGHKETLLYPISPGKDDQKEPLEGGYGKIVEYSTEKAKPQNKKKIYFNPFDEYSE